MIAKASANRAKKAPIAKQAPRASRDQTGAMALLAVGASGPWEIAIDQTTSGRKRLLAQVDGPALNLTFEISGLAVVDEAVEFLSRVRQGSTTGAEAEIVLGHSQAIQVAIIRDDEFSDRCFVVIESRAGVLVRFTLAGNDLIHLIDVLNQIQDDVRTA
jgi:hypothetical protein